MGHYENGIFTRKAVVQACKRLFYEKGYHETSYVDICRLAHVNRGTVYYHFPSKEAMCYEVMWEYAVDNKRIVEKYCREPRYHYLLAIYMFWKQMHEDGQMRRFGLQICTDHPVYTGKKDISYFYYAVYDHMWGAFWAKKDIVPLAFASVYGYVVCCMRMLCEYPEKYDPMELFVHCADSSASIWGIPKEKMEEIWPQVRRYLEQIPEEEMKVRFA